VLPKPSRHAKPAAKAKPQTGRAARGSSVLAVAARYIGTRYVYGGTTPRGFDCSGFTGYVYRQLGVSLPRTANQQMLATHRVSRSQARPGDLVFFVSGHRAYHTGIYAGHGMMYDAPRTGKTIQKRAIWSASVVFGRVSR
jgi:cell wall-associated NlpC family hydrolase